MQKTLYICSEKFERGIFRNSLAHLGSKDVKAGSPLPECDNRTRQNRLLLADLLFGRALADKEFPQGSRKSSSTLRSYEDLRCSHGPDATIHLGKDSLEGGLVEE